ncbi:hypothetical protein F5877DRAFT_86611 [Lentinula edodes]|nr:hypothetical protein F5877DRAFT_86611 [Lentinula edodes]
MPWLQPDPPQYQPSPPIDPYTSKVSPYTSPIPKHHHAPPPTLWDLSLGNVEATSYVKLLAASPLPPPTLEDVHLQPPVPGTSPSGRIPSQELIHSRPILPTTYSISR